MSLLDLLSTEAVQRGLLTPGQALDEAVVYRLVREMPYRRASDRQPETTVREWQGTCSGKHYLLQALFAELGYSSQVMACTTVLPVEAEQVPEEMQPLYLDANRRFVDVHNYLLLDLRGGQQMKVDATWPLSARQVGMIVNERFVLGEDQQLAAEALECWPIPYDHDPQAFKDRLLKQHFTPAELAFREEVIRFLSTLT